MRLFVLAFCLLAASVVPALAQTPPAAVPTLSIGTRLGDVRTPHQVDVSGEPASTPVTIVVIDPDGQQSVLQATTDGSGHAVWTLAPTNGVWLVGLYRVVLPLPGGRAESQTFVAGDGQPHLFAEPYLPSPTSAFNCVGIGLPPNTQLDVQILLTGGAGERTVQVATDGAGAFSLFVFPQEYGQPFFAAGNYQFAVPSLGLTADFAVREHPVSSSLQVISPVVAGDPLSLALTNYAPGRAVWGIEADAAGHVLGEWYVGPTGAAGDYRGTIALSVPGAGRYFLATPYDWGETAFDAEAPTPTATLTPTATATPTATPVPPTSTPTPRPTVTPRPTATPRPTSTPRPTAPTRPRATANKSKRRPAAVKSTRRHARPSCPKRRSAHKTKGCVRR